MFFGTFPVHSASVLHFPLFWFIFFFWHKLNIRQSCANLITLRNYLGHSDLGIILSSFIPVNNEVHKSPSICFGMQWHSGNAMQSSPSCKYRLGPRGQWSQQCEDLLPNSKQRKPPDWILIPRSFPVFFFCVYKRKKIKPNPTKKMHAHTTAPNYWSAFVLKTSFPSFDTLWAWWI